MSLFHTLHVPRPLGLAPYVAGERVRTLRPQGTARPRQKVLDRP